MLLLLVFAIKYAYAELRVVWNEAHSKCFGKDENRCPRPPPQARHIFEQEIISYKNFSFFL